jgi:opacity protein-like surface antigen
MSKRFFGSLVLGFCLMFPAGVAAQERVPHTGQAAVGIDVGAYVPADDQFDNALLVNALFEYYVTPRVSLRTSFGLTDPGHRSESVDSLRQIPLNVDVNYNWEGGRWHPFVGAGLGAYFLQFKDNDQPFGDSETKVGFNVGAGIEYFFNRTVTFKGEGRYHRIDRTRLGQDPSGLALTAGLKTYF